MKKWIGNPPTNCDICSGSIMHTEGTVFFNAKTHSGSWGILCNTCFVLNGVGLGTCRGQKYRFDTESGDWLKEGGEK